MAKWSGLGMNCTQPHGSWDQFNIDHVSISSQFVPKLVDIPKLRMISDALYYNSSSNAIRHWASNIKSYFPTKYINFGIARSSSAYWPTYYATYLPLMQAEATWAQSNSMDMFTVANEMETENRNGKLSVTSITRSSNVATVTTSAVHNLLTGDTIKITGASDSSYNLDQVSITVLDTTTLTYACAGSDGSAAGTLLLQPGRATIKRIAMNLLTAAEAIFTNGPCIYSFSQGYEAYYTSISPLANSKFGYNVYGTSNGSFASFASGIDTVYANLGSNMIITEFNVNSTWSAVNVNNITPSMVGFDHVFSDEIYRRMKYIQNKGIEQAYFYNCWNGSASDNNLFTAWYNTNPITGSVAGAVLQGNWKSVYDRLLEQRISHLFLGTQQHT